MQMNFKIDIPDAFQMLHATIEQQKLILWKSMHKMEELAKARCPVGHAGLLKKSIKLNPIAYGAKEYTLVCGEAYGIHVEFGTSPHYVPIQPLKDWSKRVLGDESAAYAVRAKIAKYGTDANPFFRPAFSEVKHFWLPQFWKEVVG